MILAGVGVMLYSVSVVTAYIVEGDLNQYFWKRRMQRRIDSMKDHFIVCGAGETGQRVIEELAQTKRDFVVIDPDPKTVAHFRSQYPDPILEGVSDDREILKAAGVERATGAVVALPNDPDNLVTTLSIRMLNPTIRIVTKEIDPGMAERLKRSGADAVVNPGTIGGLRLVSELVRPSVVMFLDTMLRDKRSSYRFEEISISTGSEWANRKLGDIPARSKYGLFVVGARRDGEEQFAYNPDDSWLVEPGQTLVVLGDASDVQRARDKISPSVGHFMHSFWEYLSFVANSLIFLLVGLALSPALIREFLFAVLLTIPIVYFSRAFSIAIAVPLVNRTRMIEPIDMRYRLVMYWGGLRGALALALALSLPPDFAAKELILVSAMGVVMATLLVNAVTIGPLLRLLGFDRLSPAELFARFESLLMLKRDTRSKLGRFGEERAIAPSIVEKVRMNYLNRESQIETERETSMSGDGQLSNRDQLEVVAHQALCIEKQHYWEEFAEGHLREQAYKQLIQDVDYQADHVKAYGELPEAFEEAGTRESPLDYVLYKLGIFSHYLQTRKVGEMADRFEQNSAKTAGARSVASLLDRMHQEEAIDEDAYRTVRNYYQFRHDKAQRELSAMAADYPEYVERTQEFLLTRSCLHNEEATLKMLRELGLVPDKVYLQHKEEIADGFARLRSRPVETLQLDPASLLAQIPLFEHCSEDDLTRVAQLLESESFAEGDRIVRQGESGDSMYVIARGAVKVLKEFDNQQPDLLAILVAGGFFGEIALLGESPRTASVRAASPCTMLRLRRRNLETLMALSPDIKRSVQRAYKERLAALESLTTEESAPGASEASPA